MNHLNERNHPRGPPNRHFKTPHGLRCELGAELAGTTYMDRKLRPKLVRYWSVRPVGGAAIAQHEVDQVTWLTRDRAADKLSYERDLDVLASLDRTL